MAYFPGESEFMACKTFHSMATINNKVYNWGGFYSDMPEVHSSPLKDSLTSKVEVFDMESLSWNSVATTGVPPAAVRDYTCCSLGSKMYKFGGNCKSTECYHNDLFALDTLNKEWRQVDCIDSPTTSPMKKQGAGMISLTKNDRDFLLVFGGVGLTPTTIPSTGQYVPHPVAPKESFTNEVHMLSVSSFTGWTVPVVTGTTPPPMAWFTLNILPLQDKAILFGGMLVEGFTRSCNTNVYILALMKNKNQVQFQMLHCSNSPMSRHGHSSTVVTINESAYLIVIGGVNDYLSVINDLCILDIKAKKWQKVKVPGSVCKRYDHAIASIKITKNRVLIIINGGCSGNDNHQDLFVVGADITVVVELVYSSNKDWSVVNIWNIEQLKRKKSQIHRQLVQHLIDHNYDKGTLHELITIMQSPTKGLNDNSQLRLVQQLYQEQKEQNSKLQSDVTLSRVAFLYKIQELNQSRQLAAEHMFELEKLKKEWKDESRKEQSEASKQLVYIEDLKKISRGKTMELEKLREGNAFDEEGDKESLTDKQAILKEDYEALKKLEVEDENEDGKAKDFKDQSTQFNYMIIINDCLDNIHVGGETVYLIQGSNAQSLNWTAWGLKIHFIKDTLSPNETCEVAVKALVGGDFKFPPDCELISAVYAVSLTNKVKKAVKVDMQHCAVLKEERQFQYLSFVMAPMRQRVPPFQFCHVEGAGQFGLESQYGSIVLDHFCLIAIVMVKNTIYVLTRPPSENQQTKEESEAETALPHIVQNESVVPQPAVEMSYCGQMLYANDGVNRKWLVKFMAVKDLSALQSFISEKYSNEEAGQPIRFGFDEDGRVLELIMDHPQGKSFTGWEVLPDAEPLTILREDIDQFGQGKGPPAPPYCQITVFLTPSSDSFPFINYCVPLKGVTSDTKKLFIKCFPTLEPLEQGGRGTQKISTLQQEQGKTPEALPDVSRVIASIKEEMNKKFAGLKSIFDNSIDVVTAEMFTVGLISSEVKSRQSAEAIITDFQSGFVFMNSLPEIEQHCSTFFDVLEKLGGPFRIASNSLKQSIKKNVEDKCNTTFSSF